MTKRHQCKGADYDLTYMLPTIHHRIGFHWDTRLSVARMEEICDWYQELTDYDRQMINDIKDDAHDAGSDMRD